MFYASYHPRGFSNEYDLRAFATAAERDTYLNSVPRYVYSEGYRAMVCQGSESARAYATPAAEVALATYRNRKDGCRCDGSCGPDRMTLAEYFAPELDGTAVNASGYTAADLDRLEAECAAGNA